MKYILIILLCFCSFVYGQVNVPGDRVYSGNQQLLSGYTYKMGNFYLKGKTDTLLFYNVTGDSSLFIIKGDSLLITSSNKKIIFDTVLLDKLLLPLGIKLESIQGELIVTDKNISGLSITSLNDFVRGTNNTTTGTRSFVGGGTGNSVETEDAATFGQDNRHYNYNEMGRYGTETFSSGIGNRIPGRYGTAQGGYNLTDGLIAASRGNSCIASGNDSDVGGNRSCTGRRMYPVASFGTDALNSLGQTLPYVIIDDTIFADVFGIPVGDVRRFFPDSITYAATGGDRYPTPTFTYPTGISWAQHSIMILRSNNENEFNFFRILETSYTAGVGTKIYYRNSGNAYTNILYAYSSYSPLLEDGGNGQHAEGIFSSSYGYGASSGGNYGMAWSSYANVRGHHCYADSSYGFVGSGYYNINLALGGQIPGGYKCVLDKEADYGYTEGYQNRTRKKYGHSQNKNCISGAESSTAMGDGTETNGNASLSKGVSTKTRGTGSESGGKESYAYRNYQWSWGSGKFTNVGDAQTSLIVRSTSLTNAGWHAFYPVDTLQEKRTYYGELTLVGKRTDGTTTKGESTSYKFDFMVETREDLEFTTSDVNTSTEYIHIGDSIPNNTKVVFTQGGTMPTGINYYNIYYVVNSKGDSIQVSTSQGGAAVNITSTGAGTNSVMPFNLVTYTTSTNALKGRTFTDGGDGISTGVRAQIYSTYFSQKRLVLRIDQVAGYTVRWVATTRLTEVAND